MRSLWRAIHECKSRGHNPQNGEDGQLNNSHRAPFDDGGVRGREAWYATRIAIWKVFRREDIWAEGENAKIDQKTSYVSERQRK